MRGKEIGRKVGFVTGITASATVVGDFLSQPEYSAIDMKRAIAVMIALVGSAVFTLLARATGEGVGEIVEDAYYEIKDRIRRRR